MLPADIAALVSPGPHGIGVDVGPLNNVVVMATTFDRARAFKLAANFLRAVTPQGHEPYTLAVDMTLWWRGHDAIMAADFQPAWLLVASVSALSCIAFWRMPSDAGAALARQDRP